MIGLCAQNMITILDLTFNVIGENLCDYFMGTKFVTLIMKEVLT